MKIRILTDGAIFTGKDAEDIVDQMNRSQFTPNSSIQEYMHAVKRRISGLYGKNVSTDSVGDFMKSLEDIRFIEFIEK